MVEPQLAVLDHLCRVDPYKVITMVVVVVVDILVVDQDLT
jgi:hypothetical protein